MSAFLTVCFEAKASLLFFSILLAILSKSPEIYIITGHSQKMRGLVEYVAQDYDIRIHEEWMNPGKLILDLR